MKLPVNPHILQDFPVEFVSALAMKEGNSKKPIYQIHKWWARRLGSVFRMILIASTNATTTNQELASRFYKEQSLRGSTVLDPFMGGGTSIIESLKMGARAIGVDIDPVAWFVTKNEVEEINLEQLQTHGEDLIQKVGKEIRDLYFTQVEGQKRPVIYFFWVDIARCKTCRQEFKQHIHYYLVKDKSFNQSVIFCPTCGEVFIGKKGMQEQTCSKCEYKFDPESGTVKGGKYNCPYCKATGKISDLRINEKVFKKHLYAVEYIDINNRSSFKKADLYDRLVYKKAIRRFKKLESYLEFPRMEIPTKGRSDKRPISHGYYKYQDLFNTRQLLALSLLYSEIKKIKNKRIRSSLLTAFSDSLASNNMLCTYAFGYKKLTPLFGLHAYSVMSQSVENNVLADSLGRGSFVKCVQKLERGKKYGINPYESQYVKDKHIRIVTGEKILTGVVEKFSDLSESKRCLVLNQSSENLSNIPNSSVDIILTDPPYYDNLAYSELSDFYFQWIKNEIINYREQHTPLMESLYVNGTDSEDRYRSSLSKIIKESAKKLKRNGLMVFTFHHTNPKAWAYLTHAIFFSSLFVEQVYPVRAEGKSGFHSSGGNLKWDSIVVCRKNRISKRNNSNHLTELEPNIEFDYWMKRIGKTKLDFSKKDQESFLMSLILKYICKISKPKKLHKIDSLIDLYKYRDTPAFNFRDYLIV